ncbi:hypothetical protein FOQG_01757 [Fusarium oxysporum f. sp. raphani 54005]|uniref:Uncharacterized protein n=3 Tax=Fusarium oxysporum TaxID=5507 RepID=X0CX99_FUSOX|nr:hypothetical protein FOVG_09604 [Fusarium oxysporum f. sp. pisi HDV247]EXK99120.1 hypothetical protein FOQG_01757 [Fusarium oxysporum f. sp. raphani 54005]EXL88012.1 hypothetical protein FOPG_01025 [Fusarium oxysporum f. sp. conglutinans race 2 54008]
MVLFHSTDPRFNRANLCSWPNADFRCELSQRGVCTMANYLWPRLSCTSLSVSDVLVSVRNKCAQESGRRYARSYPCWLATAAHAFERYLACSGDGDHLDTSFTPLSLLSVYVQ